MNNMPRFKQYCGIFSKMPNISPIMSRSYPSILLALLSGCLLAAAWYWHLGPLLFIAWLPLLFLEKQITEGQGGKKRLKLWCYSYLAFFVWNLLVTWWIVYASLGGACMAILANALLMSMVFLIYSALRSHIPATWSHWILLPVWMAWEHLHSFWDLSWTWLNLGNVFSFHHTWVQWYEFTGASGGTAWVLSVNLLLYSAIIKQRTDIDRRKLPILPLLVVMVPLLVSFVLLKVRKPLSSVAEPLRCLVVQPNVDPYNFKFVMEYQQQFLKALNLIRQKLDAQTDLVVLPETFVTSDINEEVLNRSEEMRWFRDSLMKHHSELKIVSGGNTHTFFKDPEKITATARFDGNSGLYYDYYNSAIYLDKDTCEVYHKSKLVPGVEKMPFPALFKPLEKLALNLGGTVGSLGLQKERTVLDNKNGGCSIAPVICYESVYSDYLSEYIRNGAKWICIVTNDGWWENTPGYKQHMNYARLRAIENRRQIARSANTGISCFIDEFGNTYQETPWWQPAVISQDIYLNDELTLFSRFGDVLSFAAVIISLLVSVYGLWVRLSRRFGSRKHV